MVFCEGDPLTHALMCHTDRVQSRTDFVSFCAAYLKTNNSSLCTCPYCCIKSFQLLVNPAANILLSVSNDSCCAISWTRMAQLFVTRLQRIYCLYLWWKKGHSRQMSALFLQAWKEISCRFHHQTLKRPRPEQTSVEMVFLSIQRIWHNHNYIPFVLGKKCDSTEY